MSNDYSSRLLGHPHQDRTGCGSAGFRKGRGREHRVQWILTFVALAGCLLIGCTAKTPEQRHSDRLKRLTQKMENLQAQIHAEQQKEIDRLRDARESPR
jgi:outer membrane murein-binding lipoprotein Lpp